VAWLSTYDTDRGEFHVIVADGGSSQSTGKMVAKRDFGVASVIMSTRAPFTTPDYLHDNRFRHDPKLDDTFRQKDSLRSSAPRYSGRTRSSDCCS
jgi:hypothetical protein